MYLLLVLFSLLCVRDYTVFYFPLCLHLTFFSLLFCSVVYCSSLCAFSPIWCRNVEKVHLCYYVLPIWKPKHPQWEWIQPRGIYNCVIKVTSSMSTQTVQCSSLSREVPLPMGQSCFLLQKCLFKSTQATAETNCFFSDGSIIRFVVLFILDITWWRCTKRWH